MNVNSETVRHTLQVSHAFSACEEKVQSVDVECGMRTVEADIQEILHEWHTPKAARILEKMGVSERNWMLFALHGGTADGHEWSFRELAVKLDTISHVRVYQIVKKTERRLRQYIEAKRGSCRKRKTGRGT